MPSTGSSWPSSSAQRKVSYNIVRKGRKDESLKRQETKTGEDKYLRFVSRRSKELQGWLVKSGVSEETCMKRQKSKQDSKISFHPFEARSNIILTIYLGGIVKKKKKKLKYFTLGLIHLEYTPVKVTVEREGKKKIFPFSYSTSSNIIRINPQLYIANFIIYLWAVDLISATCYAKKPVTMRASRQRWCLQLSSSLASSHRVGRCYASCQEKRVITRLIQL